MTLAYATTWKRAALAFGVGVAMLPIAYLVVGVIIYLGFSDQLQQHMLFSQTVVIFLTYGSFASVISLGLFGVPLSLGLHFSEQRTRRAAMLMGYLTFAFGFLALMALLERGNSLAILTSPVFWLVSVFGVLVGYVMWRIAYRPVEPNP